MKEEDDRSKPRKNIARLATKDVNDRYPPLMRVFTELETIEFDGTGTIDGSIWTVLARGWKPKTVGESFSIYRDK